MNNINYYKNMVENDIRYEDDDFIDEETIEALNESIKLAQNDIRPPDNTYTEKLIDSISVNDNIGYKYQDEDEELVKAINESMRFRNDDLENIIFEEELKKAIEENEKIENERLLNEHIERHKFLKNFMKYIIHSDIKAEIIKNIKESINDFLEMKTNNIIMDEITYLSFINYLDKKNHRINTEVLLYIKSKL
jgi:hypothetical protein